MFLNSPFHSEHFEYTQSGRFHRAARTTAAVTGGWKAVAVALPAVQSVWGGGGAEAIGGTDSPPRKRGARTTAVKRMPPSAVSGPH